LERFEAGIRLGGAVSLLTALGSAGSAVAATESEEQVLVCVSDAGKRNHCDADVSGGVALRRSTGSRECLLGRTWGYDDSGVWVAEGCGGEFVLGRSTHAPAAEASGPTETEAPAEAEGKKGLFGADPRLADERPTWGGLDTSGYGIVLFSSDKGQVALSAYALVRYIDQQPADQTFIDHLGNERPIDTRRDFQFHRAMIHIKGWAYTPKLRYQITTWTVMSTDQTTLYGYLGYQFDKKFNLYGGINTLGGSRSVMGSHPLWLANDRVMADEFFRGSFSGALWANGEILPGLWYHVALANNLSQLGVGAGQLSRDIGNGFGLWWMPTTHEFGPLGAYGDWEWHEELAIRTGAFKIRSRENRQELSNNTPENTQVRLADSVLLFDTGSLAPGVTVQEADWESVSMDFGIKYKGIFAQVEFYRRWLDNFVADGPLPVTEIEDDGWYLQAAFFPIKKKLEVYGAHSRVNGDEAAGFGDAHEYILGANYYPANTRNFRVNAQVIDVTKSAVSSVFGFYVGGQTGTTYSVATSMIF
jgi:hypothetical protein